MNMRIPGIKHHAENILRNHNFQSGNGSIIKRALCYVQDGFFAHPEWEGKLLITIHDEIICTQLSKYNDEVVKFINDEMVRAGDYYIKKLPVVVDVELGYHWIH